MKYENIFFKNDIEYKIEIKLDDEHKNGHDDFSITASICQYKHAPNIIIDGCCHQKILMVRPEYAIFIRLHLSDWKGVPMHAVENGSYFIKEKEYDAAKSLLRISDYELEYLKKFTESKDYFTYAIQRLGLLERWKAEADIAIAYLMRLCKREKCPKFKGVGHFKPLSKAKFSKIAKLEENGYFN